MSRRRMVSTTAAWTLVAAVVVLTVVGEDVRGFLVGAAGWKNWTVDHPLSLVTIVSTAAVVVVAWRLARAWAATNRQRPADDRRRRRLNMALFAFAVVAPMALVNARSLGRLVVFDHPRKDLGWKAELIDVASWLSDNRLFAMAICVIVAEAFRPRRTVAVS